MDVWDVALLLAGGYVGVITLVRLMQRRRDAVIAELTEQAALEQKRQKLQRKRDRRRQLRQQMREAQRRNAA